MKIGFVRTSRRGGLSGWALGVAGLWLLLVGSAEILARRLGWEQELCLFRRFTGMECPSCGLTRGVWLVTEGELLQAWLMNPLFFSAILIFGLFLGIRLIFGLRLQMLLTYKEKIAAWIIAAGLFLGNWLYVIHRG